MRNNLPQMPTEVISSANSHIELAANWYRSHSAITSTKISQGEHK